MILVVIPAVAVAVVSIAAFGGRWVWWLDVLANFRVQYLVALVVLGVVLMVSKWRRTGVVVLVTASVNVVLILPLFVGSPGEVVAGSPSVELMSFNLLSTNESYSEVIEYVRSMEPDVVLLHEASRPWEVAMEAEDWDYRVIRPRSENLIFGTLVLVAADDVEVVSYGFAEAQPRAVSIGYQPDGWGEPVKILSTHPLAPTSEERAKLRDAQLGFAADWATDQTGAFMVVGDFNATPWSWPFRRLESEAPLRNSQIGFGLQPSFAVTSNVVFRVPIDHLLHSTDLVVADRRLGPAMGSDHFPLLVTLHLHP